MASSLCLLLLMIFLWIGKLYNDEVDAMQKEGISTLRSVVSELQSEFYEEVSKPANEQRTRDSILVYIPQKKGYLGQKMLDSLISNNLLDKHLDSTQAELDRWKQKYQRDIFKKLRDYTLYGNYNFYGSSYKLDSNYYDSMAYARIEPKFDEVFKSEYQNADVFMYPMQDIGDTTDLSGLLVARLFTMPRDAIYAFVVTDYKQVIIKRLLPQILFSLVVFVCTVLAFVLILLGVKRLRQFSALKNDFVSNMTHELKTPISTVAVALEGLTNFDVLSNPKRSEEYIDISKKELHRLSILVDKVLKMTMFDEKEPELHMEPVELRMITKEVAESMKLLFDKASGVCKVHSKGSKFSVIGDKVHLTNVIYNLIENALKYSPDRPQVDIELQEQQSNVLLSVKDRGIGIDKQFIDKVFEKFFRVPTGDKHNTKGHGLGLAYVTRVLDKHKGWIVVASKKGEGSTFQISLPKAT